MRRLSIMVSCLLFALAVLNAQRATPEENLLGFSEMIIVGTVTDIRDVPLEGGADANMGTAPGGMPTTGSHAVTKMITFRVEEPLLGTTQAKTMTVGFPVYAGQKTEGLPVIGEAKLFFLQRTKNGYTPAFGLQGIQSIDKIETIETLVKAKPLSMSLAPLAAPLFFGKTTQVTVTIANLTDAPLSVRSLAMGGFFYAKRMESNVSLQTLLSAPTHPITIDPKDKKDITLYVTARTPNSMALLGADSYMMTIAALYCQTSYSTDNAKWLLSRSNWQDAYLGFSMEAETETEEMVEEVEG